MKIPLTILAASCLTIACQAETYLFPTNPPPCVSLAWNASPGTNATGYWIYYGIGSRQYTNKVASVGTNLTLTVSNLVRGATYYFTATARDRFALESAFCNEVSYTPPLPPSPPDMQPLVILTVQTKTKTSDAIWANSGMYWSMPTDAASQFYRLELSPNAPQVAAVRVDKSRLKTPALPPPLPGGS